MMHKDEMNKLINDALRDAPPAPDALRHNVMSAIHELEHAPKKQKFNIFKAAPALAFVAVLAIVIIVTRPMLSNDKAAYDISDNSMSTGSVNSGTGGAAFDTGTSPQMATFGDTGTYSIQGDESPPGTADDSDEEVEIFNETGLSPAEDSAVVNANIKIDGMMITPDNQNPSRVTYVVTGDLPAELDGLEYTVFTENYRIYENVPDFIIEQLLAGNAFITESPVDGAGNVIKWIP